MNDILKVENLNKSYGDFSLTDVTFSLPEGCITGFIGINGAGKTTTLRTLLGLAKRNSGNIQFFGLDMEKTARSSSMLRVSPLASITITSATITF